MHRAYPKSVIRKFGHAHIFMLLDATEIYAQVASMKTVNAILYSAYKHNSTVKWLVGCDPIGTVWDKSISEGYPGCISDPVQTAVTGILNHLPFGSMVEVDKGFIIENHAILLGIKVKRPMKLLEGQTQQSSEDAALTQKVGKTRIPIEQANGQMKQSTAFFDRRIRIDQIGLADLIFRASYLLTNFKLPFIQDQSGATDKRKMCNAEIRYYGGTADGLVDIRPYVDLWGCDEEKLLWHNLREKDENRGLSDIEISELVYEQDIPSKLRKIHLEKIKSGDFV